jgi:hypothetical protein
MGLRTLYIAFAAGLLLLLLASCGNGRASRAPQPHAPQLGNASDTFALSLENGDGKLTATLNAQGFFDLYQVAGALGYDSSSLELESVSQGAFLGGPAEVIFFQRGENGRIPFALTKRDIAPGAIGNGAIVKAQFRVKGTMPQRAVWVEKGLLARDSQRHKIDAKVEGGAK